MPLPVAGAAPADAWIGTVLAETYRVERLLGEGGMGSVYEASHTRLPRRFAIKALKGEAFRRADALARFRREAEVACQLKHRHIIEVLDYNTGPGGQPYIVMELLEGESLAARLAREPALTLAETAEIVGQAASALHAAHGLGVVHRDLKPENIFLCDRDDGAIFVKVLDFGISKVLGSQSMLTAASVIMGTPSYMAPEQAEGRVADIDARTDVFAMGAILYQMLAGRPPFVGENITAVLYQTVHQAPPPLRELTPLVPAAVERVVARALAKRPEDRQQSLKELAEELLAALVVRPTVAQPRPTVPAPPAPRLRPPVWFGLGVGALTLAAVAVVAFWPRHRPTPPATPVVAAAPPAPSPAQPRSGSSGWLALAARALPASRPTTTGPAPAPAPASQPAARETAASQPAAEPEPPAVEPPTAPAGPTRGAGSLRVVSLYQRSAAWADVFVDRKKRGQTPLLLARIAPGAHVIEVRREGFRAARKQVVVTPGGTTMVRLELRRGR